VSQLERHLPGVISGVFIAALLALLWPQTLLGPAAYLPVSGDSMRPHIESGDLAIVRRGGGYQVGEVIAYRIAEGETGAGAVVIHRITRIERDGTFVTKGDNRLDEDPWRPTRQDVLGREWFHVPGGGSWLAGLRSPLPLALLAAVLAMWVTAGTRESSVLGTSTGHF